jgi:Phosphopantetheine attachment site
LLAIRIISRALRTFQVELPVRALFESPTVADMALMIVQNQTVKAGQEEVERMLAELEGLSREEARKRGAGDGL